MLKKWFLVMAALMMPFIHACAEASVPQFMESYLWQNRVVVIFTPTENDMTYGMQQAALTKEVMQEELEERDIVRIDIIGDERVTINGETKPRLFTAPFRTFYNVPLNQYGFILIGKDGEEKLRSSEFVLPDTLLSLIDSMPMRAREMRESSVEYND
jgi:hypothetical protein